MINDGKRIVTRRSDRKPFIVEMEEDEKGYVHLRAEREGPVRRIKSNTFNRTFCTRYAVVAIDETQYWCDEDLVKRCGGKIYTLYVYNPDEASYLCEATPSYELEPMDYYPADLPEDEDEREAIYNALMETFIHENVSYVHCRDIDNVRTRIVEDFPVDCTLEAAHEYWRGNSPCIPGI